MRYLLLLFMILPLAGCIASKPPGAHRPVAEGSGKYQVSAAMRQKMQQTRKSPGGKPVLPLAKKATSHRSVPSAGPDSLMISDTFGLEFFINERLDLYRQKDLAAQGLDFKVKGLELVLGQEEQWQQCLASLAGINDGYQYLWDDYQQNGKDRMSGNDFLHVCRDDIVFLEGSCPMVEDEVSRLLADEVKLLQETAMASLLTAMEHYGSLHRYQEVRHIYLRLQKEAGSRPMPAYWQEAYGRALVGCGRLTAALAVFRGLAAEDEGEVGLRARLQMVELLVALGKVDQAREQSLLLRPGVEGDQAGQPLGSYQRLFAGPDLKQQPIKIYGEMLYAWLTGNDLTVPLPVLERLRILNRYFPETEAAQMGQRLRSHIEQEVALKVDQRLQQARMLAAEGKYGQALSLLSPLEDAVLPIAARRAVAQLMVEIEQAGDRKRASIRRLRQEALESGWQQANNFFDQKKYDQAFVSFHSLLNTSYRPKVKKKMVLLSRQAAADLRQAAARYFVKARDAATSQQQLGFLVNARGLLQQIIDKYPEVSIIDKVRDNLAVIEDEIRSLELKGVSL